MTIKDISQRLLQRQHLPALVIFNLSLAIMWRMFMTPDVVVFREPLVWGFINWAHRFPVLIEQFRDVFLHGAWYPRWLPDLMGGNGYPTFLFYQPGAFFFTLPFALLFSNGVIATKLSLFVMLLLAGGGAYKLARLFTGMESAIACTVLFLLNPYLIANLYLRAAYSEFFAMTLCPWVGYLLFRLYREWAGRKTRLRSVLYLMLSLAALGASHPFVSVYFSPVLVLLLAALCIEGGKRSWTFLLLFALSAAGAVVMAAPYLLGVLQMRSEVNYEGIQFTYLRWLLPLGDIVSANPASTLLAAIGLWSKRRNLIAWALLTAWALLCIVQTPYTNGLWHDFQPLVMTQLPYRALSSDAIIRLMAASFAFAYIERRMNVPARTLHILRAAIVAACLVSAALMPIAFPPSNVPFSLTEMRARLQDESHAAFISQTQHRYDDQSLHYDFIPRRVKLEELAKENPFSRPMVWADDNVPVTIHNLEGDPPYHVDIHITVPDSPQLKVAPVTLHLRQFYLKGWSVSINGQTQEADEKSDTWSWGAGDDARIRVNLYKPGEYQLQAGFEGPPHWLLRNLVMLVLLAGIYIAMRKAITL